MNIRSIFTISCIKTSVKRTGFFSLQNVQLPLFSNAPFCSTESVDFRTNFLKTQFKKSLPSLGVTFFSEFMRPFLQLRNAFHEWLIRWSHRSIQNDGTQCLGLS